MNRLATLLPLALAGCAIPYDCDAPPLVTVPDGGIDPTMPAECLGRCDPARCPTRARFDPSTCDCREDLPDDPAPQPDASPSP